MDKLFLTILNMSLTGSFVIAVIYLARLPLRKAPKIISYCLWAVAGFRLAFPYSIKSMFSLIPFKASPIPTDIAMQSIPRIDSGIPFVNDMVGNVLPAAAPAASVNPLQIWTAIGAYVWLSVVAVMLIYCVVSFIILKQKMQNAVCAEANIYEAENIKSPFVLGIFTPKIYLPAGLSLQERGYIILHEQTHIKRRDHIIKFAAYFILCLHWFNPLVWVAFLLMGVDMEMSCDERVLKEIGEETKKDYSLSLLSLATERRIIGGSPLAFGEGGVKERIKNVLKFRKPSRAIITLAVAFVIVLSTGFAMNRAESEIVMPAPTIIGSWEADVYIDGELLVSMPPTRVRRDDEYEPSIELREFMAYLGYSFRMDDETGRIELSNNKNTISLRLGESKCVKNGAEINFYKSVYTYDDIIFFPQSFFPAVLGMSMPAYHNADDGSDRIRAIYISTDIITESQEIN